MNTAAYTLCYNRLLIKKILKWCGSFSISSNKYYFLIKKCSLHFRFDKYCIYVVSLKQFKDFLLTTDCFRLFGYVFLPFSWTELVGRWSRYVTDSARQYKKCTNLLKTGHTFSDRALRLFLNGSTWHFTCITCIWQCSLPIPL